MFVRIKPNNALYSVG